MQRILSDKTAWRTHAHARTALLVDGRDYYRAFYEAARRARRSVLLAGWQLDSDVLLLRGDDQPPDVAPAHLELLPFLDQLCRERPELEVRMLAWDHSLVFALEREPLQKLVFDVASCDRVHFAFDGTAPLGGSHHQKLAIVDGRVAFVGSMDICQSRWDESPHRARDPRRVGRFGLSYGPYHEVQAALAGPAARSLVELFTERWRAATGEALDPADLLRAAPRDDDIDLPVTLSFPRATIGLSRTMPEIRGRDEVREVRALHQEAILAAERLVYIETQYLTSRAILDALVARMRDRARGPLSVVIVLPRRPAKLKEELTIGPGQAALLAELAAEAAAAGHALGVYDVAVRDEHGEDVPVYVHSKLMVVDDRLLTVGSANLANRSMLLDSELNASWEAGPEDAAVRAAIRRARVRLLSEHLGEAAGEVGLTRSEGLVARLDAAARARRGRLRLHELDVPPAIVRAVHELTSDVLDPNDGSEPAPASGRTSAA